ncbi:MAG: dihydrofolate synthase / folylpolyglutamate synthase [Thermotogaceae bacterium]|nr:dihydrofolate synthase / folylpolyglutamate synthase [Thermotogaceae bacterium]
MNYLEALNYLYTDRNFSKIRPGLKRVKELLEHFGNPQNHYQIVHITGTNGKGSTSYFLYSILKRVTNLKVGLYTSPHLSSFRERIVVNDEKVSKDYIVEFVKSAIPIVKKMDSKGPEYMSTFFELTTAMAFKYFKDMGVDIVVLEVGLGGRYDATNVVENPLVSVITTVDLEHTRILGDTIEKIAFEKAGIIKENSLVVTGETKAGALNVIKEEAVKKNSKVYVYNQDFRYKNIRLALNQNLFDYEGINRKLENIELTMNGKHQFLNCSIALAAFENIEEQLGLRVSDEKIKAALKNAVWPGRFELIEFNSKSLIIDGAHNPAAFKKLRESIEIYFPDKRKIAIIGILDDKDYKAMLQEIKDVFEKMILTRPLSNRTTNIMEIHRYLKTVKQQSEYIESPLNAFKKAIADLKDDEILVVTGSLYLAGYLRNYIDTIKR